MKLQVVKDKKLRTNFFFMEKKFVVLKYILENLLKYSNDKVFLKKIRFIISKEIRQFNISKTKIVRRCVLTGRARSSTRFLNISRIKMREFINKKIITDIKKRSW